MLRQAYTTMRGTAARMPATATALGNASMTCPICMHKVLSTLTSEATGRAAHGVGHALAVSASRRLNAACQYLVTAGTCTATLYLSSAERPLADWH